MRALIATPLVALLLAASPSAAAPSDRDSFLHAVAGEIGLFYVYRSDCPSCRIASPQIRAFSDAYGVTVRVISTDGGRSPEFASAIRDTGQVEQWGLASKGTPALMLYQNPTPVDPRTGSSPVLRVQTHSGTVTMRSCQQAKGCVTFLAAGAMSANDIAERVFDLLAQPASPR